MGGDLDRLYHEKVQLWARKVRYDRRLASFSTSLTEQSAVCGSRITLDFVYSDRLVTDIGWMTRSCMLGMASTACLVEFGVQEDISSIIDAGRKLEMLLKGFDPQFDGKWRELEIFRAGMEFPSRHTSILLPFSVAEKAWIGFDSSEK